jgi:hypothetical protein
MERNQALQIVRPQTAPPSSPSWLQRWQTSEPLPSGVTAEAISRVIAAHDAALQPAPAEVFAVSVDRVFAFARTFNIAVPDTKAAVRFYRDGLADIPADLLDLAMRRAVDGWKWGNRLPMPADIKAQIAPELAARKLALARLKTAEMKARKGCEPVARKTNLRDKTAPPVVRDAIRRPDPELSERQQEAEFQRNQQRLRQQMAADPDFQ